VSKLWFHGDDWASQNETTLLQNKMWCTDDGDSDIGNIAMEKTTMEEWIEVEMMVFGRGRRQ